jgi:hypothetical protein
MSSFNDSFLKGWLQQAVPRIDRLRTACTAAVIGRQRDPHLVDSSEATANTNR